MDNYAIVLAAGRGKRMGKSINKQFMDLCGKPVLAHTLLAFENCNAIKGIVIVSFESEIEECISIAKECSISKVVSVISGGSERQDSVLNGLHEIERNYKCQIVSIHDGARPLVTSSIIEEGIALAKIHGGSYCSVKPKNTIKILNEDLVTATTLNRDKLLEVQTPQSFNFKLILEAHEKLKREALKVTDDTSVFEHYGYRAISYEGAYENIKITTPLDMILAEEILKQNTTY